MVTLLNVGEAPAEAPPVVTALLPPAGAMDLFGEGEKRASCDFCRDVLPPSASTEGCTHDVKADSADLICSSTGAKLAARRSEAGADNRAESSWAAFLGVRPGLRGDLGESWSARDWDLDIRPESAIASSTDMHLRTSHQLEPRIKPSGPSATSKSV